MTAFPVPRAALRLTLIWTLFWHHFVPRNQRDGFTLFWVFAEPASQLAILMIVFTLIGRDSAYGTSFALFLLTGIAMLHFFTSASNGVAQAVATLRNPNRLPGIGLFEPAIAALGFRMLVALVSTLLLGTAAASYQRLHGVPADPVACAAAFLALALFALGTGILRGHARRTLPAAERVYNIAARALIFVSGVFYVPSYLPPALRDLLWWNPVLHGIDWLRTGVYPGYPEIVLSRFYLVALALGFTAFGITLVWFDRRRMLE